MEDLECCLVPKLSSNTSKEIPGSGETMREGDRRRPWISLCLGNSIHLSLELGSCIIFPGSLSVKNLTKLPVSSQLLLYKKEWAPHSLLAYSNHSGPFLLSSSDLMVKTT